MIDQERPTGDGLSLRINQENPRGNGLSIFSSTTSFCKDLDTFVEHFDSTIKSTFTDETEMSAMSQCPSPASKEEDDRLAKESHQLKDSQQSVWKDLADLSALATSPKETPFFGDTATDKPYVMNMDNIQNVEPQCGRENEDIKRGHKGKWIKFSKKLFGRYRRGRQGNSQDIISVQNNRTVSPPTKKVGAKEQLKYPITLNQNCPEGSGKLQGKSTLEKKPEEPNKKYDRIFKRNQQLKRQNGKLVRLLSDARHEKIRTQEIHQMQAMYIAEKMHQKVRELEEEKQVLKIELERFKQESIVEGKLDHVSIQGGRTNVELEALQQQMAVSKSKNQELEDENLVLKRELKTLKEKSSIDAKINHDAMQESLRNLEKETHNKMYQELIISQTKNQGLESENQKLKTELEALRDVSSAVPELDHEGVQEWQTKFERKMYASYEEKLGRAVLGLLVAHRLMERIGAGGRG